MKNYPNLRAEMARTNTNQTTLAKQLGISVTAISSKITGRSQFTIEEARKIRDILNKSLSLDYLFETA